MKALEIDGIRKSFGGVVAVDGLSFSVDEGETVGIIGPNGAGKTTVFNLVSGFYRVESGSVSYFGNPITNLPPYRLSRLGIARTFQNLRLFANLSVFENVLSAILSHRGYSLWDSIFRSETYFTAKGEAEKKARVLIDFFQLTGKEDYPAKSLPYGDQRRLELARALSTGPRLLLIDEPGAGMNPKEIRDLVATIREVRSRFSVSIVIIEHQMGLLMNVSDRVVVMDFGEKIMEGPPEETRKDERVIKAYLGEAFQWKGGATGDGPEV